MTQEETKAFVRDFWNKWSQKVSGLPSFDDLPENQRLTIQLMTRTAFLDGRKHQLERMI